MNYTRPEEHLAKAMYQIEKLDEQVNYLMGESIKARDDIKSISSVDQKVVLSNDCSIPQVDALEDKFKKLEKRTKLLVALGAAFI
jgi:tetrahydromethanopterin S-methyltransferase subunit G